MIGEILKKKREELGRDLREIADSLKIRYDYLKALENGDFEKLPAEVYVKGYIQEYAKILHMDPETAIKAYLQQTATSPDKKNVPDEKLVKIDRFRLRYVLIPSILALLIIIASFQLWLPHKKSGPAVPMIQPAVQKTPIVANSELILDIAATDPTWLFVTIDEADSKEVLMRPGETITWRAKKGFFLKIGNAGGIRLVFNGKEIGNLGEKGQVVKMNLPDSSYR